MIIRIFAIDQSTAGERHAHWRAVLVFALLLPSIFLLLVLHTENKRQTRWRHVPIRPGAISAINLNKRAAAAYSTS